MNEVHVPFQDIYGGTSNPYASIERDAKMIQDVEDLKAFLLTMNIAHERYSFLNLDPKGVLISFHDTTDALLFKLSYVR